MLYTYIISFKDTYGISTCAHVHVTIICEKVTISEQVYFVSKYS